MLFTNLEMIRLLIALELKINFDFFACTVGLSMRVITQNIGILSSTNVIFSFGAMNQIIRTFPRYIDFFVTVLLRLDLLREEEFFGEKSYLSVASSFRIISYEPSFLKTDEV